VREPAVLFPEVPLPLPRPALLPLVVHTVYAYKPGAWGCEACDFLGAVDQAIRHAVRLQWDGRWPR
jgi:hypothetical protein